MLRSCKTGAAIFLLVQLVIGAFSTACTFTETHVDTDSADSSEVITLTTDEEASQNKEAVTDSSEASAQGETTVPFVVYPEMTDRSVRFSDDYDAAHSILINADDNEVIAYRNHRGRMYPASLTKVMTLIVAVENISNMSERVLITNEMVDPMIALDASRAGFVPGETPELKDVLYGMILMSGADASLACAEHIAGSEEAFVALMNSKAEEMGLKNTHFTNVSGLHDLDHYSTAEDMAVILEYAIQNSTCREILECYEYKYGPTELNPEGLTFTSTLFSRMYGDEMPGVLIKGGKTGYTDESGNCIESFAEVGGKTFILVLCGGKTNWNNIYDTLSAYSVYCAKGDRYEPPTR